jgi:hypothetical protein
VRTNVRSLDSSPRRGNVSLIWLRLKLKPIPKLLVEEAIPKYELTVEDARRLAKKYSCVLMQQHRAQQTAESTLLKLKKEAIAALPGKLQASALVSDMIPFPANRYMATHTPPIEGYIEKVRDAAKKYSVKKLR